MCAERKYPYCFCEWNKARDDVQRLGLDCSDLRSALFASNTYVAREAESLREKATALGADSRLMHAIDRWEAAAVVMAQWAFQHRGLLEVLNPLTPQDARNAIRLADADDHTLEKLASGLPRGISRAAIGRAVWYRATHHDWEPRGTALIGCAAHSGLLDAQRDREIIRWIGKEMQRVLGKDLTLAALQTDEAISEFATTELEKRQGGAGSSTEGHPTPPCGLLSQH